MFYLTRYLLNVLSDIVYFFFKPLSPFFDRDFHLKPKRILVMYNQIVKIGDSILITPAINALRKRFPSAFIAVMVTPTVEPVFRNNPDIDKLIVSKYYRFKKFFCSLEYRRLKKENFDLILNFYFSLTANLLAFLSSPKYTVGFDLNGSGFCLNSKIKFLLPRRRTKHEIEYYLDILRSLGVKCELTKPRIFTSPQQKKWSNGFLKDHKIQKNKILVGIHPGAAFDARTWPKERFISVIDMLAEKYDLNFLFFGDLEKKSEKVTVVKNISLNQLLALIERCDLFICNDSGPMHMAVALDVPVVAIFGPQTPAKYGPIGDENIAIHKGLPCSPCKQTFFYECKPIEGKPPCLHTIKTEEVFRVADYRIKKLMRKIQ